MNFKNQALTLHSDALPENTLMVTRLVGEERLSGLFRFELDLLCQDTELDLEAVLYAPARLGIEVAVPMSGGSFGSTTRQIAGVFADFEMQEEGQGWVKYRAVLVPKLWQLTRTHRSRIFMGKAIDELVAAVLEADGLDPTVDFEFQLSRQGGEASSPARAVYPQHEYVVQYEESDWDFVARWLEHEGVYFHFVNDDAKQGDEKVVFADTVSAYASSSFDSTFPYRPESSGKGAESDRFGAEEVYSFRCRQTRLPEKVTVNDYNWRTPSAELLFSVDVRKNGTGHQTEYNDHFKTEDQGVALAEVRAEELACRARWFRGESSCRTFRPGATFTLEEHFRDELNDSYLLVEVRHEAEQMISLESSTVTGVKYSNTFQAIPATQCFRPERTTPWPSIKGVMHAKIDAEGDGKYAELDALGRYKLTIPFDEHRKDSKPGKASRWVRMAQPYAGPSSGMHFPLLKGTEVLLTHIDGDPDRPIIAAAVPNPETESPSTGANRTRNSIRTASGNVMQIDDDENASGFVFRDATGSRVSDFRWRTGGATAAGSSGGSTPTAGGGGAVPARPKQQVPAALPAPGAGMAVAPAAPDPEGEIISTVWDEGVNESDGAAVAWKAFFRDGGANPTAFQQIATKGRYSDETASPLTMSPASDENGTPLLADTTLTQANIVTLFNHLLKKHPRASETATVVDSALSGTIGKLTTVARNFEALAAGSAVGVEVGDSIKVVVGDMYEYVDGSYDIKIGTGGYSREETRGEATKDTYRYGKSTENEYNYGDKVTHTETRGKELSTSTYFGLKETFEFEISGSASQTIAIGGQSETSVKIGGVNENTICAAGIIENEVVGGLKASTDIFVGGKFELELFIGAALKVEIAASACLEVEISAKAVFKTKNFSAILSEDKVTLNELNANLKSADANILKDRVGIAETNSAISDMKTTINKNTTALQDTIIGLNQASIAAQHNKVAAQSLETQAMKTLTSGITMIQ
ncbi:MAG TPA: type VI secretion system tip protein TssI/VgrG [Planctomycetota bacterium]|nr:type VI secretion system tip protein TssI/VgrG [Planctomycetota bacterium]